MRLFVQESGRYVVERTKGTEALTVNELVAVAGRLPNGYRIMGLTNRDDGTTVLMLQANERKELKL